MAKNQAMTKTGPSRRQVLTGAAVGGGLLVTWWAWPRSYTSPLEPGDGEHAFGAWLTVGEDSVITVAVPQLEMGQGITTILPQIIAMEMGADWRQIAVVPAPPSGTQPNIPLAAKWAPLWSATPDLVNSPDSWLAERFARTERFTATADGTSLTAYERDARVAGATARAMLAMAAADEWDVAAEEVRAVGGLLRYGDRTARFGEMAKKAAVFTPPDPPPLLPVEPSEDPRDTLNDRSTDFPRLDLPAKVDGSLTFAADIRLPGMVHASVRHGPVGMPELASFDAEAASSVSGVISVVKAKRWIAVIAENWWQAERGAKALKARFSGPGAVSSLSIEEQLDDALQEGEPQRIAEIGTPEDMPGAPTMTHAYSIAPAQHASIETSSATAHYVDGRLHLWIASQAPEAARDAAARSIGLSLDDVVLYPVAAGGSFDARLEHAHAIEAAQIAEQLDRPVQLTWSRAEETKTVPPRAPVVMQISAKLNTSDDRAPLYWKSRIAAPPAMLEFGNRLFSGNTPEAAIRNATGKADPLACEGAVPPYAIPNVAVDHIPVELFLPTGRLRGNSAAYTAFANESFVDELARGLRVDPLSYRIAMMGEDQRMSVVLRRVGQLASWDGGRPESRQGIAMVRMEKPGAQSWSDGGRIACVARALMVEGQLRITTMHAVADIGRIVNVDIARQQIEGGLLFGLGLAMGSSATWENGLPNPVDPAQMKLPALADAPEISVDFIPSEAPPFDPGELSVAVAAPAIANAFFALSGDRLRSLPLFGGSPAAEPGESGESQQSDDNALENGETEPSDSETVEQVDTQETADDQVALTNQEEAQP